jgi:hypothetical protein
MERWSIGVLKKRISNLQPLLHCSITPLFIGIEMLSQGLPFFGS